MKFNGEKQGFVILLAQIHGKRELKMGILGDLVRGMVFLSLLAFA